MNVIVYNELSFVIEFVKVFFGGVIFFNIKIKNKPAFFITFAISISMCWSAFSQKENLTMIYGVISLLILLISIEHKNKILHIALVYFVICLIDMIFSALFMFSFNIDGEALLENYPLNLLVNAFSLIVISIVFIVKYRFKKNISYHFTSLKLSKVVIYIVGIVAFGAYITSVQYLSFGNSDNQLKSVLALGLSASSIIFIVICVSLIISNNKNEHLENEQKINLRLLKTQEEYYTMLNAKNEETRKFRHDMSNHIYCMHTLLKDKSYNELDLYFEEIGSSLSELKLGIHSGNKLVDAIVNDLMTRYPNTIIDWTGKIPSDLSISSMDLCTVFANTLDNAFEASNHITVYIKCLESALFISVTNPIGAELIIVNDKLSTTKVGGSHGFGLENIKRCMIQNKGSFEYKIDDGFFIAEIIFSDAIK